MIDHSDISGSNGTRPNAGPQLLFDSDLERMFVAALLANPALLARVDHVAVVDLIDFHAVAAFSAIRNLQAQKHPITVESVRAWLIERDYASAYPQPAGWPSGWLDALADLPLPPDPPVLGWAYSIMDFAVRRAQAFADAQSAIDDEADIDRDALGDVEPSEPTTTPDPDPWPGLLRQAITDVAQALSSEKHKQRRPMFVNALDLFQREYPQTPWQVTGLITRGGTATLGAEPKTCKTWLAVEIAVAVATGTKVCGEFFAERGTVAYFFAEDLDVQVRNRVRALMAARGVDPTTITNLFVCPRGQFLDITKNEDLAWVIASCRHIGKVDLVVLDPLRDVSSASEDKSDEMAPVMKRLRLIGELLGCTVMVSHHAAKASESTAKRRPGQRMRGSSVIHGSTDSGIYLALNDGEDGGDGVGTFVIEADVEIKGARSAGAISITLELEDDSSGEAVGATWSVGKRASGEARAAKRQAKSDVATGTKDDRVFSAVVKLHMQGRREFCTARSVRAASGVHPRDVQTCLDRLVFAGRLWVEEIQRSEIGPQGKPRTMTQTVYSPVTNGASS